MVVVDDDVTVFICCSTGPVREPGNNHSDIYSHTGIIEKYTMYTSTGTIYTGLIGWYGCSHSVLGRML